MAQMLALGLQVEIQQLLGRAAAEIPGGFRRQPA